MSKSTPEIIIQDDGSLLIPRGEESDNTFFCELLGEMVDKETMDSLEGFFGVSESSDIIFGSPGLCG